VDTLPPDLSGVIGGGMGNSQAEKPWVIFFQPYLQSRQVGFCPTDRTPRSQVLARDLNGYNGGITATSQTPLVEFRAGHGPVTRPEHRKLRA
jgi:hypothetical protein